MPNQWNANSSHKTDHYELNQWGLEDEVAMEDFNYDNVQIDEALHAVNKKAEILEQQMNALSQTKANTADVTAGLAGKGNRIAAAASYAGGIFALTATGTLPPQYTLCFKAPTGWNSGNSLVLNGTTLSAITVGTGGGALQSGAFSQGDLVSLEVEGTTAFFRASGGSASGSHGILPSQTTITVSAAIESAVVTLSTDSGVNFAGTMLVVKAGGMPQSPTDGLTTDAGTATTVTIAPLQQNMAYYIRAFAYNANREYQTDVNGAVQTVTPAGKPPIPMPTYSGIMQITEHAPRKFYAKLLSSGTLTFSALATVDVFLVGGGGGGATSYNVNANCGGGGGGYTTNALGIAVTAPVSVSVGAGGAGGVFNVSHNGQNGGTTSFGSYKALGGCGSPQSPNLPGDGGAGGSGGGSGGTSSNYGGNGGSNGSDGTPGRNVDASAGRGQRTSTRPFGGDRAPFSDMLFAGGGGGGGYSNSGSLGGTGGGGHGHWIYSKTAAQDGAPNTGGGGGGANWYHQSNGASGGSGIAIIRWGEW